MTPRSPRRDGAGAQRPLAMRAAAGCALALGLAAPGAGAAESVTLTFGWPEGLTAEVAFEGSRTRFTGTDAETQSGRGRYRLRTESAADGLLVRFLDLRLEGEGLAAAGVQGDVQRVLAAAANTLPDHVVDRSGRLLRVVGVEGLVEGARGALSGLDGIPAEVRVGLDRVLARILSLEVLEQKLAEGWNRDVGAWAGATLERGQVRASETTAPVALLGDVELPMRTSYEYVGPVSCGDGAPGCVHLRMRSTIDSARAGAALGRLLERLAERPGAELDVRSLKIDGEVNLVTEASTLLPHRVSAERRTHLVLVRGGRPDTLQHHQRQRWRYRYE